MRIFTVFIAFILAIGLHSCKKPEESKSPIASFTMSPGTGPFTVTFLFDASSSYDENESSGSLQVRWDFDGNGIFDTEFTTAKTAEHKYTEADNYNVGLEVMNSDGWNGYEEIVLVVYADSLPPIPTFTVEPDSSSVATIFLFNAAGSSDPYTPQDQLKYRWDWQNDGSWDTPFMDDSTFYHKYELPGIYKVMLEVKNNYSVTDTTSRVVHVYDL